MGSSLLISSSKNQSLLYYLLNFYNMYNNLIIYNLQ
jgi:hypothetical protein